MRIKSFEYAKNQLNLNKYNIINMNKILKGLKYGKNKIEIMFQCWVHKNNT